MNHMYLTKSKTTRLLMLILVTTFMLSHIDQLLNNFITFSQLQCLTQNTVGCTYANNRIEKAEHFVDIVIPFAKESRLPLNIGIAKYCASEKIAHADPYWQLTEAQLAEHFALFINQPYLCGQITTLQLMQEFDIHLSTVYFFTGEHLLDQKSYEEAKSEYQKAIELNDFYSYLPGYEESYWRLSAINIWFKEWNDVEIYVEEGLKICKESCWLGYYYSSRIAKNYGNIDDQVLYLQKTIELNPRWFTPYIELLNLISNIQKPDAISMAQIYFLQACENFSKNASIVNELNEYKASVPIFSKLNDCS